MSRWNRETALLGIPELPEDAFKHVGDRKIKPQGGGGGGGHTTATTTNVTSNVPEYASGAFMEMIGKGAALAQSPYQAYGGERVAQFSPLQQQAYQQAGSQQVAGQLGTATHLAGLAGFGALGAGNYHTGFFNPMMVSPQSLQQFQMQGPGSVSAQQIDPNTAGSIQAAQTGFNPNLQQFQMQGPESFLQGNNASAFTSPFMQQVVDAQKREAARQSDIRGTQEAAQMTQAGAFGGSRDAIMRAERERNLAQQMGDIQARGSQAAFENAQQQFNAEQAAQQQARQTNLQARLGVQELGTQTGLQTALANLSNQQQANVQNAAQRFQAMGMNQEAALRAALSDQQMGFQTGQQNLQARLSVQELGSQQGLQSMLANQQALMDAQKATEQSRQFGSSLGLEGYQTALQGAGQLGQLGQQQFGQQMDITNLWNSFGREQQAQIQRILDQQYADFQQQRDYPYQQIGFMSDLLRGAGSSTRSIYTQPQASGLQTLAGAGSLLAGLGMMAAGGEVKKYATGGGITGLMNDQQLAQQAQQPGFDGVAAQDQMMDRQALRGAAPGGLPVEQDQTEEALVAALQAAMAEGDQLTAAKIQAALEAREAREMEGIAGIAPDAVGDIPEGGIVQMASGGETPRSPYRPREEALDTQRAQDREALRAAGQTALTGLDRAGRAIADVVTLPVRGVAGAYDSAIVRPMRVAGLDAAYLSPRLVPAGADVNSMTPFYDMIRQRPTQAQPPAGIAALSDVPETSTSDYAVEEPTAQVPTPVDLLDPIGSGSGSSMQQVGVGVPTSAQFGFDADAFERQQREGIAALADARRTQAQGDYDDLNQTLAARGVFGEQQEARIQEALGKLGDERQRAKGMAVFQAGMAILAADPSKGVWSAIGQGALQGLGAFKGDVERLEERREALLGRMERIEELRRQESAADDDRRMALRSQIRGVETQAAQEYRDLAKEMGVNIRLPIAKTLFEESQRTLRFNAEQRLRVQSARGVEDQTRLTALMAEQTRLANARRDIVQNAFRQHEPFLKELQQAEALGRALNPAQIRRMNEVNELIEQQVAQELAAIGYDDAMATIQREIQRRAGVGTAPAGRIRD